ncbi:CASP-like protein [Cardamine amara subsp. amara]|uniref:CASP-like protein n=1 Tax=Cardamine amara subsp. amara TaxID=228776 RepID=A0ABD1BM81_CARAN
MENVPGSFGTSASFALRLGQTVFSAASLIFMCFDYDFYDFTTFCYLATVMAIVTPWSILLGLTDTYSVLVKLLPQEFKVLFILVAGDFVLSFLSLGGACAVTSGTGLLLSVGEHTCDGNLCSQYQVSATLAFLCWFLLLASALFNFWSLPSLYY